MCTDLRAPTHYGLEDINPEVLYIQNFIPTFSPAFSKHF